jgi:hypothetical protein
MATDLRGPRLGDGAPVGGPGSGAARGRAPRWTAAHAETARFLGECVGAGAVLGMVAAMSRGRGGE